MREIKFSYMYQHEETGRWIDLIYTLDEIENGNVARDIELVPRFQLIARRQCIEIKDTDAVEIYEGDIVKHRVFAHNRPPEYYRTICVTDIREDYGWLRTVEGSLLYSPKRDPELKVIGNIYKNPELLNRESDR